LQIKRNELKEKRLLPETDREDRKNVNDMRVNIQKIELVNAKRKRNVDSDRHIDDKSQIDIT
jgi:hypothetical protein